MKRYVIVVVALSALLLVVLLSWPWRGGSNANTPVFSEAPPQALAGTNSGTFAEAAKPHSKPATANVRPGAAITNQYEELENARYYREFPDLPVALYGLVLDQDSNALQSVTIDVDVTQWDTNASLDATLKMTHVQGQTGADGRFQISGVSGHTVTVNSLTKDGYEPELIRRPYEYGPRAGSINEPVVFTLWSTNLHQPLVAGNKSFVVVPDGRRYAIDLIKGTITEGQDGDLVAWIKRPEAVKWGERYDWSCELTTPGGGLLESSHYAMLTAPQIGYTNAFAYREDAGVNGWGGATGDRRFYIRLRNGQMYGRIVIDVEADYHGKQPAMIRLSYAVNPSGSRLLR